MTVVAPTAYTVPPQATWQTLPSDAPLRQIIARLNVKLSQWAQTIEGCRQGVSGPRWSVTVPTITAAQTLTPLASPTVQLVDATGGAFATTLWLSTTSHAAGAVVIVKRVNAGGNVPTIITQSPDVFGDTGGGTLSLSSQFQTYRLVCDGAGTFWEW